MATAIIDELVDQSTHQFSYGGWFELAESRGLAIQKVPYAIKFWYRTPKGLGSGPTLFSVYSQNHLCIFKIEQKSEDAVSIDMCRIRDLLRREDAGPVPLTWAAEFVVHLVSNEGGEKLHAYIVDDPNHFRWEMSSDGDATFEMDESLIGHLYNNTPATSTWVQFCPEKASSAD